MNPGLAFALIPAALAIAVLSGVESLLSAVVADGMAETRDRHDSDRELVGQGLANLVAPVMGGMPATAAIARTAAAIRNGGNSRLTGMVHGVTVLMLTVVFAEAAGDIPLAVLAAILIVVAYNIADVSELRRLVRAAPREDLIVLFGTMGVTVVFDLVFAIAFGVVVSVVLLLRRLIRIPVASDMVGGDTQAVPVALGALLQGRDDVLCFNAQGVISFHSAAAFEYQLPNHDPRPLVLRMRDVHYIDASGLITLEEIIKHRQHGGGRIVMTEVPADIEPVLRRFGLFDLLGPRGHYATTEAAVADLDLPPPGIPLGPSAGDHTSAAGGFVPVPGGG